MAGIREGLGNVALDFRAEKKIQCACSCRVLLLPVVSAGNLERQCFTQFLFTGSAQSRRWIVHVCVWTGTHWSEGEKPGEVKLTLWHSWCVRGSGWWVTGLMRLMLDLPEIQMFLLLAVMFSSKPTSHLPCMPVTPCREEGEVKRDGVKPSSAQAEVLNCPSALSPWIHPLLVERKTWI